MSETPRTRRKFFNYEIPDAVKGLAYLIGTLAIIAATFASKGARIVDAPLRVDSLEARVMRQGVRLRDLQSEQEKWSRADSIWKARAGCLIEATAYGRDPNGCGSGL